MHLSDVDLILSETLTFVYAVSLYMLIKPGATLR